MQVIVSGKNLKVTPSLKEYATEKATAIQKYFDHIIETDITLSVDKHKKDGNDFRSDVTVWANGTVLKSMASDVEMHSAINQAIEKIERQLKKYKQKLRDNRKKPGKMVHPPIHLAPPPEEEEELEAEMVATPMAPETPSESVHKVLSVAGADGDEHSIKIIREQKFAMRPMTIEEATLQLTSTGEDFLVFSNPETSAVTVVYRRSDGNVGLIEPLPA